MSTDTKRSIFIRIVTAAMVVTSVAGCSAKLTQSSSPTAPGEASPIKVTLSYQPSGTAALGWDRQSGNVTAKLQIGGFTPGSTYAVDIHNGNCAAIGDVAVPFPKVTADSAGTVSTTVTGERLAPGGLLPSTALSMHMDTGTQPGGPSESGFAPLACGEITAAVVSTTLTMAPVGQRPGGWANLTYNPGNKTLVVATAVSGLAPGSTHTEHIGVGTCEAQGAVKYPLNNLVASANGNAYQTTVIQNVDQHPPSSGWYLTVHSGPSAETLENGQQTSDAAPIACGDIGKVESTS